MHGGLEPGLLKQAYDLNKKMSIKRENSTQKLKKDQRLKKDPPYGNAQVLGYYSPCNMESERSHKICFVYWSKLHILWIPKNK